MVGNKKILGLLVCAIVSIFGMALADESRVSSHKKLIYDDTDLIIRDKNKKVIFQVLSSGLVEVKDADGKKSLFTATPKTSKVEVNRGKMKIGDTELTVATSNVSVGGDMSADNVNATHDVTAGGAINTGSLTPITRNRVGLGVIEVTDGIFKFGPTGAECTMDASTGKINLPAGMFYGKDSIRFQRQLKYNSSLTENSALTLMTIPVPTAAAAKPFSCVVDITYLADAASSIDEYDVPTYVGTGYAHIRFLMAVFGDLSSLNSFALSTFNENVYDYEYLRFPGKPAADKIVKILAPEYVPGTGIVLKVSNTPTANDSVKDIDGVSDFLSPGILVNQFVHIDVTLNMGTTEFEDEDIDVEHDDDEEPEVEYEDEE